MPAGYDPVANDAAKPLERIAKKLAALFSLAALGCGGHIAAYVSGEAIASNKAVEAETSSTLVTNILRARDGVPT